MANLPSKKSKDVFDLWGSDFWDHPFKSLRKDLNTVMDSFFDRDLSPFGAHGAWPSIDVSSFIIP